MINWTQITIGVIALLIGTTVYLTDRSGDHIYFIDKLSISTHIFKDQPSIFGVIGKRLPSFVHAFAFILITAGLVTHDKKGYIATSLFWLGIDWAFELGQHFHEIAVLLIPDWFAAIPFFEHSKAYFRNGTFDWYDMVMILFGSIIAFGVLMLTQPQGWKVKG